MCHTLHALRILFNNPCTMDRNSLSLQWAAVSRKPLSNVHMMQCYLSASECQDLWNLSCLVVQPKLDIQHCHLIQHLPARSFHLQPQLTKMQHVRNLNVYFVLGNELCIGKLNPLFPTFTNLAFKKCIRQCLLEFPLTLAHGNTLKNING